MALASESEKDRQLQCVNFVNDRPIRATLEDVVLFPVSL